MDPELNFSLETAPRRELQVVAAVMFIAPWITSFVFPDRWAFIDPKNKAYRNMLLAVYFAFVGSALTLSYCAKGAPWISQFAMLMFFLVVHISLWGVNEMWAQTIAWGLVLLVIVTVSARQSTKGLLQWLKDLPRGAYSHWRKSTKCPARLKVLSVLFSVFPIGMLAGPTFSPWERVQKYVRWHPYNEDAELLWRGNFFTFSLFFFITSTNPIRHGAIVLFFAWHGLLHGTVMLIDNLRDLDGNGNWEHAFEISFFFLLGLFCSFCLFSEPPRDAVQMLLTPKRKLFYGTIAFAPGTLLALYLHSVKVEMDRENAILRNQHVEDEVSRQNAKDTKDLVLEQTIQEFRERIRQLEAEVAASRQAAPPPKPTADSRTAEAKPLANASAPAVGLETAKETAPPKPEPTATRQELPPKEPTVPEEDTYQVWMSRLRDLQQRAEAWLQSKSSADEQPETNAVQSSSSRPATEGIAASGIAERVRRREREQLARDVHEYRGSQQK
ncbi:hypothetical protein ATCC90586_002719 [Pythium insidiosum]|nr:hypothetical protein ATCC90586_002719 [Pythium insidiosum]